MCRHEHCSLGWNQYRPGWRSHRNGPSANGTPRLLVSKFRGSPGEVLPAEGFLHSGMRWAAVSRDPFRWALRLGSSIADGLGEHLAQLDFSLRRFAREG